MGNFIYIDTDNKDFPQKIGEAVTESLGMASSMAGRPKFKLKNKNHTREQKCESLFNFVKEGYHVPEDLQEQEDSENEPEWQSVKYCSSFIMKESEILSTDLSLVLQLNNKSSVGAEIRLTFVKDAPDALQKKADIAYLNQMTFDLIQ
jgi:hypothetical protein